MSGPTRPNSFVIPSRAGHLLWADVSYRLTLGWLIDADGNAELTLERFEVGGHAKVGGPCARYEEKVDFVVTLFFGDAPSVLPSASRADPVTETGPGPSSTTDAVTVTGPDLTGASAPVPRDGPGVTSVSESVAVTGPVEPILSQDTAYLTVNGSDFPSDNIRYPATGHGYGFKFGDSDLAELSRRPGISKSKLQEALGTIKQYRLKD